MQAQLSFVLSQITSLTDGQTDRILIARPHLHSMQWGNYCIKTRQKHTKLSH